MRSSTVFLFALALSGIAWCRQHKRPFPRAFSKAVNVDPQLDCAIKELAWDYAKKLLPGQGDFASVYNALQLDACNVSRAAKRYEPRPFSHCVSLRADARTIYVDAVKGSDSNPGTLAQPVKTVMQGVRLSRMRDYNIEGLIYLRAGTYYLTESIRLAPEDSNLVVSGYPNEKVTISGGKEYKFDWKQVVKEMGPIMPGVNAIYGAVSVAGSSNGQVWFYGKLDNATDCQMACEKNTSCFAFTWHDSSTGDFALMCYFRIDGLWVHTLEKGHYSGKKLVIYAADLRNQDPSTFNTLFINSRRAIRARYPDGNPETMGLHTNPTGYVPRAKSWLPPEKKPAASEIHIQSPARNGTHFPEFQVGIGGPVAVFDPPESYWGTKSPTGGGGHTYEITTGLVYSIDEGFANRTWINPSTGIVHAYHCSHWGGWMFQIADRNSDKRTLTFRDGGFQEARGCASGAEWYVENIIEELDAPNEWYYNETTKMLFYYPNGSLPDSGIGTVLPQLFSIEGTMDMPVSNVSFVNLTLAHTASTFLKQYEVPSGGDWAIHNGGAIFVEGVDGFLLQNCLLFSPGGNGVFLTNYVRNAVIEGNEFVYVGDSAIAAVGTAELIDGTLGNQPRGTQILSNLVHEIGIWGKQTSAYFQSVVAETILRGNVMFNGPRAGINFNDGFGGGHFMENNLLFNWVRETSDHGPFNSWDRQPYLTKLRNGTPSLSPAQSNITLNFIISNYNGLHPLDHDDGSCYYYDTYNYFVYGGYKNYLGHSKVVKYNYYVYPDANPHGHPYCGLSNGASTTNLPSGWGEVWVNNTCIIGNPNIYEFGSCTPTGNNTGLIPFTANNTFYAPNEDIYIKCGNVEWSLAQFQKEGYDIGSHVYDPVSYDTIIEWGRKLLGI